MNNKNKIYPWRIKKGAYAYMSSCLQYPQQVDSRMNDQICRITVTDYTIERNIRRAYHKELEKDHVWQVEVLGITDREFLVLQSQLINLQGDLVVIDEDGKRLFG